MDFKESGNDNNESKILLEVDLPKNNDPIITFSPDRSRFDPGQNHKSRNASIASDFDLNLEVSYSTADTTAVNQQPPNSNADLLSSSSLSDRHQSQTAAGAAPPLLSQFSSANVDNIINLDLKQELSPHVRNGNIIVSANGGGGGCSGQSMSTLVTASLTPSTKGTSLSLTRKMSAASLNGTMDEVPNASSSSTVQLQKKLEKKISQAKAIAAAMNSMTPNNKNNESFSPLSPKDETEFGDFNTHYIREPTNSKSTLKQKSSPKHDGTSSTTTNSDPQLSSTSTKSSCKSKSSSSTKPKNNSTTIHKQNSSNRYSAAVEDKKPACVKFQENEVEIICKSSRANKVAGGSLLPPERLAVPHKSLVTNNNSNARDNFSRKHSSSGGNGKSGLKSREEYSGEVDNSGSSIVGGNHNNTGSTSEVKPLVEWDSDESEDELSFFPAGKPKAKLTDNLSIDNMSLSGEEEDDLHLSPPRAMTQKCPCDPRQWISDHVSAKLPKSNSFPGGESGHCVIS